MRDPKECLALLKAKAEELGESIAAVCGYLLDNPNLPIWSGSSLSMQHHYGKGGLINHLYEVVNLCMINKKALSEYEIDERELFMAALFHDAGKLFDYKPVCEFENILELGKLSYDKWESTTHKRYIHHISRSAIMWTEATMRSDFIRTKYHDSVLHAILAHHGFREAGSPVAPKSRVAWLVHLCDNMSARMYDAETLDIIKK